MKAKRFTLADIQRAYRKIGYTPIRRRTLVKRWRQCCPLAALALASGGRFPNGDAMLKWGRHRFGLWFTGGFLYGFDGKPYLSEWRSQARKGLQLGCHVAKALGFQGEAP